MGHVPQCLSGYYCVACVPIEKFLSAFNLCSLFFSGKFVSLETFVTNASKLELRLVKGLER